MIVNFKQYQGHIFAITQSGEISIWDIKQQMSQKPIFKDQNKLGIKSQIFKIKISANLLQIFIIDSFLITYNNQTIFIVQLKNTSNFSIKQKDIKTIPLQSILKQNQKLNLIFPRNNQSFIIISSISNFYQFNLVQNKIDKIFSLILPIKQNITQQLLLSNQNNKQKITCAIQSQSDNDLLLIGYQNGRIIIYNILYNKITLQLTEKHNKFQPVKKIILQKGSLTIYSLHQNYLVQWNLQLLSPKNIYELCSLKDFNIFEEKLYFINGQSYLIVVSPNKKQLQLSMRFSNCLLMLKNGNICVGGSNNLIDIFQGDTRLITLFII